MQRGAFAQLSVEPNKAGALVHPVIVPYNSLKYVETKCRRLHLIYGKALFNASAGGNLFERTFQSLFKRRQADRLTGRSMSEKGEPWRKENRLRLGLAIAK